MHNHEIIIETDENGSGELSYPACIEEELLKHLRSFRGCAVNSEPRTEIDGVGSLPTVRSVEITGKDSDVLAAIDSFIEAQRLECAEEGCERCDVVKEGGGVGRRYTLKFET